jgi:Zn-dependent protease with chaperone function
LADVQISERLGNTPRLLSYATGGHCEVTDLAALETLLASLDHQPTMTDRMQHSLAWAVFAAFLIVLSFLAAYRYVLPWGAQVLAQRVPGEVLQQMGDSTLATLDRFVLHPSKLGEARQKELSESYAGLKSLPETKLHYRIVFRSSPQMGANAFALPDGTIVLLDELVELTGDNNEIFAVLAHERGHVESRHALRLVLQSSVVGLVMTWYMGDVSTWLATLPAMVVQAKYSRDMEQEADGYAQRILQLNALSPCLLSTMLDKLEVAHRVNLPAAQSESEPENQFEISDYLSSHPASAERKRAMCPTQ